MGQRLGLGGHVHELLHVAAATLFVVAAVSALNDYRNLRERVVLHYSVMCLASAAYACHVAVSHNLPKLGHFWIPWTLIGLAFTFSATFFYLLTVGEFLGVKVRSLAIPLAIQGGLAAIVLLDLASFIVTDWSWMFSSTVREVVGAHQRQLGEAAYTLRPLAKIVAALFMLSFTVGIILLFVRMVKIRSKDPLLYIGVLTTMAFIVSDTLVALSVYGGVYLIAFSKAFETVRIRRDIGLRARERIERRLRQAEKMQSIGRVAGGIAHDFGNILTAIGGSVELAIAGLDKDDPVSSDLKIAEEGVSRGRLLVHQLLDVARSKETESEVIDVSKFLLESATLLQGTLSTSVRLKLDVEPDVGHVMMPPGHLTQVMLNLVVNARDAMPEGGSVVIRATSRPESVRGTLTMPRRSVVSISVADEGQGIPTDVIEHIFEPLFTTKTEKGGSGIGLATLYSIVHKAGGTVGVESHSGRGTRFDILLPRLDD